MVRIDKIKASGEYVVLKFEKVEDENNELYKKKKGIWLPNGENTESGPPQQQKQSLQAYVHDIGPAVKDDADFKVGDIVIFNDYDVKFVGDFEEGGMYGITKAQSVMATYTPKQES